MSCACCNVVASDLLRLRSENDTLRRQLAKEKANAEYYNREWDAALERRGAPYRSLSALRGALTKAKKRIAELKGGGE